MRNLAFRGAVESLLGVPVSDLVTPLSAWIVIGVIILVLIVSDIIPAQMFARIPISSAFRGYKESKRRRKISLLAFQFAINAVLVSLVLIVSFQYRKVLAADLAYVLPFLPASGNNVMLPGDDRELFNIADEYGATEGFCDMMGFRLTEGAFPKGPFEMAVSQSFVTKMAAFADWSDGAVGKVVELTEHEQVTIRGVYEDYVVGSVSEPDNRPSVRFCWNREFYTEEAKENGAYDWSELTRTLVVRLKEVSPEVMRKVEKTVKEVVPDSDVEMKSYSEKFRSLYATIRQMKRTYTLGAMFALLLAVVGLISYARDENYRRSTEIAIRKVNGAQSSEIVSMLVTDVMKVALAAVAIGDACAWFVAYHWLRQFALKITLPPLFFIVADILVLAVIMATIVLGSLRISRTNPVESLKNG